MPDAAMTREEVLDSALDGAYAALLWISEFPNRTPDGDPYAITLAEFARGALVEIEEATA